MHKPGCHPPPVRRFLGHLSESGAAFRAVFANRSLRRIQLAWAASIMGTWAYGIAVVVYAYEQGGATAVGVVTMVRWLAAAAASPFAALLGDRYDRRWVMVGSDLARAALIGAAGLAVFADAPPLVVYAIASLVGVAATPFRPAQAALTPALAQTPEELTAANVTASSIESVGIFGGPALGGLPIALVAVWPNQIFALVLLGVVGIGNTLVDVAGMTLLQRAAPEDVLARVFGVLESLLLLTPALGAVTAPLLLNWLGTRGALIVAGALLPLLVVPAWPALNAIDRAARVPVERLNLLRRNAIFAPLPQSTLEQLAAALDAVTVAAGDAVIRQGESGDRFYL